MHARIDCTKCRKKLLDEAYTQYLKHEYDIFESTVDSATTLAIATVLAVMERRGKDKQYIHDLYEEMRLVLAMPTVFGKQIKMEEVCDRFAKEYDIDWDKLELHYEDWDAFLKRAMK